jgi:hypothetical protein
MLFLVMMEVLHAMIRKSDDWSLFHQIGSRGLPHRASLYADNMIMFVCPTSIDLLHTRNIFSAFEGASSLGCNMAKCQMGPIRYSDERVANAAEAFPC